MSFLSNLKRLSAVALLFASLPVAAQATAPSQPAPPPPGAQGMPQAQAPKVHLKSGEAKQFAAAVKKVQSVRQDYSSKIKSASGDKKIALERKGQQKMVAAVKAEGLSTDRYNQILMAVRTDPTVAQKVKKYLH